MEAKQIILSRLLPKTGQTVEYCAYDDGDYERGWWKHRLNADNKTRFVDLTLSGDAVVIDRATDLMWPKNSWDDILFGLLSISWIEHIANCEDLTFGGFSDWRMPNITELFSLFRFVLGPPYIWPAIQGVQVGDYWSSTTVPIATTRALSCDFYSNLWIERPIKTNNGRIIPVRGGL